MADESISKFYGQSMHELSSVVHGLELAINIIELERLKLPLDKRRQSPMIKIKANLRKHLSIVLERIEELKAYDELEDPRQQTGQAA